MIFSGVKAERLTRWMVSRIHFAVWNMVAASPIAAVAVPNTSAIDDVDEREMVVAHLRCPAAERFGKNRALVLYVQLPAS